MILWWLVFNYSQDVQCPCGTLKFVPESSHVSLYKAVVAPRVVSCGLKGPAGCLSPPRLRGSRSQPKCERVLWEVATSSLSFGVVLCGLPPRSRSSLKLRTFSIPLPGERGFLSSFPVQGRRRDGRVSAWRCDHPRVLVRVPLGPRGRVRQLPRSEALLSGSRFLVRGAESPRERHHRGFER